MRSLCSKGPQGRKLSLPDGETSFLDLSATLMCSIGHSGLHHPCNLIASKLWWPCCPSASRDDYNRACLQYACVISRTMSFRAHVPEEGLNSKIKITVHSDLTMMVDTCDWTEIWGWMRELRSLRSCLLTLFFPPYLPPSLPLPLFLPLSPSLLICIKSCLTALAGRQVYSLHTPIKSPSSK